MTLRDLLPTTLRRAAWSLLVALAVPPTNANAQDRIGTLIVAHGGDSAWNARVLDVARQAQTGGPIEVSFLMGPAAATSRFQDAVARLEAKEVAAIVVVPMLVSSWSGHFDQIRYLTGENVQLDEAMHHHLEMAGIQRPTTKVPLRLARAMDDAVQVSQVLAARAESLAKARQIDPRSAALFIIGHGPNSAEDYAEWMRNLRVVADSVKRLTGFSDVRVDLVQDDAPAHVRAEAVRRVRELIELQHKATQRDVVVVPILVSSGSVNRSKIPADLEGLPIAYSSEPLLPHPAMARWVEEQVRTTSASRASVSNVR